VIRPWFMWSTSLVLAALLGLCLWRPDAWLAPGHVSPGHAALADDCFACHAPWRGVAVARCLACHKSADIGLRTVAGAPLPPRRAHVSFHQQLARPDCMACHGGHSGAAGSTRVRFEHALLAPLSRAACASCHIAPPDDLHSMLPGPCSDCHAASAWRPANFDHASFFALDDDHRVACTNCHAGKPYSNYSCTGCHVHSPERLRAEHAEEGVRASADCVRCHRSTSEHGEGREGREGRDD
jgi:hypothetical protein